MFPCFEEQWGHVTSVKKSYIHAVLNNLIFVTQFDETK